MTRILLPSAGLLCLVLAKQHSRRLPGKNKRLLRGRPLYAYTLDAAIEADIFTRIVVSSDDVDILGAALQWPGVLAEPRPPHLADDKTTGWDVLRDYLAEHDPDGLHFQDICLLTPCHPFRNALHVREAFHQFKQANADALLGVTPCPYPPELSFNRDVTGLLSRKWQGLNRKEDHPQLYYPNGAVIFVRREHFQQHGTIYGGTCYGQILEWPFCLDIDTRHDLDMAERLFPTFFPAPQKAPLCVAWTV